MKRQKIRGLEDWKIGKENSNDKRRWIATQPAVARNDGHSPVIPECLCRESRRSAFTLVELVIVIAIVIILSVVSVPIYRGYTRNAKMAEGYALLGTILSAQKAYYSQYGNFLFGGSGSFITCNDDVLGVDARGNKYFTAFIITRYGGSDSDSTLKYKLMSYARMPDEIANGDKSYLYLTFDITKGDSARFYEVAQEWN